MKKLFSEIPRLKGKRVVLRELNADDQLRAEAYYREKRLHDEASALGNARREGRAERDAELIAKWRLKGYTEEQIKELLN